MDAGWTQLIAGGAIGLASGLLSSVVVEQVKSRQRATAYSRLLRAEVEILHEYTEKAHAALSAQAATHMAGRAQFRGVQLGRPVFKATLPQLSALPADCLRDVVRFYQDLDNLDGLFAELEQATTAEAYTFFYQALVETLARLRVTGNRALDQLGRLDPDRLADQKLAALRSKRGTNAAS